jgi:hypothetical protein
VDDSLAFTCDFNISLFSSELDKIHKQNDFIRSDKWVFLTANLLFLMAMDIAFGLLIKTHNFLALVTAV